MPIRITIAVLIICVLGLGLYAFTSQSVPKTIPEKNTDSTTTPSLISVSADDTVSRGLSLGGSVALEKELRVFGDSQVAAGLLSKYAIYYREFSGPVISIHEDLPFSPASLLKLPIAMWFYNEAQRNPDILSQEIQFNGPKGISIEHFSPHESIQPGNTYTIEKLIELMLQESDNDATNVLSEYAGGQDKINEVYTALGVKDVTDFSTYTIDVHTYAAFFRVLFQAQYLNRTYSQRLLEVLTGSSFVDGLKAGVPSSVLVAHKFGERVIDSKNSINQLHDCGIVYAGSHPYTLCVMTQGKEYEQLIAFIATVSEKVYNANSTEAIPSNPSQQKP